MRSRHRYVTRVTAARWGFPYIRPRHNGSLPSSHPLCRPPRPKAPLVTRPAGLSIVTQVCAASREKCRAHPLISGAPPVSGGQQRRETEGPTLPRRRTSIVRGELPAESADGVKRNGENERSHRRQNLQPKAFEHPYRKHPESNDRDSSGDIEPIQDLSEALGLKHFGHRELPRSVRSGGTYLPKATYADRQREVKLRTASH